jgi:hypothetical protein
MAEQRLTGLPGAPGMAAGRARVLHAVRAESGLVPESGRAAELERARRALAAAGAELIDPEPRQGMFGLEVAFVHPDSVHGVLTEVVSGG